MPSVEPNYLTHAFKSQYNLIGLGTALGFSFLSGSPLPLFLAAGIELIVLPLVSWSQRFQRLVRARVSQAEDHERQTKTQDQNYAIFRQLSDHEKHRYRALEGLAAEIRNNYAGLDSSSRMLLDDLVNKLEFLLQFYLRMRASVTRYERYFATTDPERIEERIAMLDGEIAQGSARVKEIKAKTRAVLLKRMERYHKALENKQLVDAQTETVQEVLQLLRDQSYSMRDPRTITEQLDGLVSSAEETERGVRDMEEILAMDQDTLAGLTGDLEDELGMPAAATPPTPQRVAAPAQPLRMPPPPAPSSPPPPRKKLTH
ncbi:MAG TPA: hypothetical protein VJU18_17065 [Vicinamibacteria bacterium]|nr:hypothetical protein [Vicinamibacteria bacterium]